MPPMLFLLSREHTLAITVYCSLSLSLSSSLIIPSMPPGIQQTLMMRTLTLLPRTVPLSPVEVVVAAMVPALELSTTLSQRTRES